MMHQKISLLLFVCALLLLIPGLTLPMLTLKASIDKKEMADLATDTLFPSGSENSFFADFAHMMVQSLNIHGSLEIFDKSRSVLGTMQDLYTSGNEFVAFLIGFFAVVIPILKLTLTVLARFLPNLVMRGRLERLASMSSKWSMSDVFVMAIIVGYLAANAGTGPDQPFRMNAELGPGFYYFAAYCLSSILSVQFIRR